MEKGMDGYAIVKGIADDKELDNYRLCFERNGSPKDLKSLQWIHQQNLARQHTIFYAMHGNAVAAIYTAMPVIFNSFGKKLVALQSIDTMTDTAHRGKGLFPRLAEKLYQDAADNEFELVYGFPNENSAPGFFKKLQWVSLGEAPFLIKPMSLFYFIKKILRNKQTDQATTEFYEYSPPTKRDLGNNCYIEELDHFEEEYEKIWQSQSVTIGVSVDRSAAYMNWRYVAKPGETYSKFGYYIDGVLKGIIVFTIKNKHGGRLAYLMELIYDSSTQQAGQLLLAFASRVFRKEKADAVLAWSLPHAFNYRAYRKSGYYPLPEKLRPQHLFFGVRSLGQKNKATIEQLKNWYISYSDSDTV